MRTIHLDPHEGTGTSSVVDEIDRLLGEGKRVTVTVAEEHEMLSPQQAADRLGFSRQHVVRLITASELVAEKFPGSSYWRIPLDQILAFERRREQARRDADAFSRSLDGLGAPLE